VNKTAPSAAQLAKCILLHAIQVQLQVTVDRYNIQSLLHML